VVCRRHATASRCTTSRMVSSTPGHQPRYRRYRRAGRAHARRATLLSSCWLGVVWGMAEPGDGIAAGASGHSRLRASHADREQVIGVLKAAFVQGRLAKEEFDLRVEQVLVSRTYGDLAALTADLPAAPPPRPAPAQSEGRVRRPGLVLAMGTVAYAAVWPVALALPTSGADHDPHAGMGLVVMSTFFYVIFLFVAGAMLVDTWQWKRSARRLPPGRAPGAGGQASPRPPSPGPGRQLPPADPGHRHTAEAARRRLPRPSLPGSRSLCRWRARGLLAGQRLVVTGAP
jgi:hypothetical protein